MAKKKAAGHDEVDSAAQKDKREFVRSMLRTEMSMSTKDVADALLKKGYSVPDHADKSATGTKNWATFGVWVSNQRKVAGGADGAGTKRGGKGERRAEWSDIISSAQTMIALAGSTEAAMKILDTVATIDITSMRKGIAKIAELEKAIGKDKVDTAIAVLFGNDVGNG